MLKVQFVHRSEIFYKTNYSGFDSRLKIGSKSPQRVIVSIHRLTPNLSEGIRKSHLVNSQAPDQKSNPQAPDRTYTSISVKTLSKTLEIVTHVFAGAEKHNLTL